MVIGIGIDIIEIDRIKESVDKFGDHFLNKIFTQNELEYCLSKANKYQHLAARFAAKEAVSKALATGWNNDFNWKSVEISNEPTGEPIVKLTGKLANFLGEEKELKITMSHSNNYVTCFAIIYLKK
ncbi:MAG: holo-[acyl-carrier-protein] synthase [Ignavibacteria bacterium CG_4_8_14_3_um_filter_37_9]|nr:holo-[acyl-carrier-protein] synthase [Ignavibacteria bacterium]OIO19708.1 MAG: holo-[acyl-carrier-protein] synthase [Ignavibacteria bacterium CG1_02_37_35]PIP76644.1 MAG: holo-[acyl-carrier-protein] synthase [Ignavibacteria bacterium CG22_combo_CG10-13_8_21_14_all_37_15]PIS45489.1 MAG: holo-[acyl-carrier-protein] synthase [Ignavibacteria bacterium CG08_land_8_20_14_0_20_37_9]PIW99808.1 MAG: holo-[acyl-carrier-protein] synthase [Ignavibacteria bacterium CG_4_8_14_3_um_filter_37_9]PIX95437.1 